LAERDAEEQSRAAAAARKEAEEKERALKAAEISYPTPVVPDNADAGVSPEWSEPKPAVEPTEEKE
jgi:hypothetical protein